jgi:hypothetical protein
MFEVDLLPPPSQHGKQPLPEEGTLHQDEPRTAECCYLILFSSHTLHEHSDKPSAEVVGSSMAF